MQISSVALTTKAKVNSCACYSINSRDCLCKRCEEICWIGYYSSVFQTYQNDRKWLNISPFKWVSLFSRVHWCTALSDLLAFNTVHKSIYSVWERFVCVVVCKLFQTLLCLPGLCKEVTEHEKQRLQYVKVFWISYLTWFL